MLVVHHGGSGTMLGALAHGLPQLRRPQGADQFLNAEALLPTGAAEIAEMPAPAEVVGELERLR